MAVTDKLTREQMMAQFDDLLAGLPLIWKPGSEVIDVFASDPVTDRYVDYGGGVTARSLAHWSDIRTDLDPEEGLARELLKRIDQPGRKYRAMFIRFTDNALMAKHCQPQKEDCYVLRGGIADRCSDKRWIEGDLMSFRRMELHEPFTAGGCFLFGIFT